MRPAGSCKALYKSERKLSTVIKHRHEPRRSSWARRQNKVDELPIEPTAWNPDNDDVRLPVRVGRIVSISLIPRDLEHGGRPMQRPAPESAIDTHGPFRDRLPAMLCATLALASAVALVLLYLDSPFRTHHGFGAAEGDHQNSSSEQSPRHLRFPTREHHVTASDQDATKLATRTLLEDASGDHVSAEEERATATELRARVVPR
ncbi:hypothetical protein HPB51_013773 [Rhipicephalus microplus]|uniref:Uncharacterized protein n=1 Tax=Rhipicephalus microplus TaxID=6941 RepID=A0A9J6F3I5_RHIMP|nr:hypothetical protein HPB51_013773 [Rhipicephalus microplus]